MVTALLTLALLAGCGPKATIDPSLAAELPDLPVFAGRQATGEQAHVLVVINKASAESVEVGAYYRNKRSIPKENVVFIDVSLTEEVNKAEYLQSIETPVKNAVRYAKQRIDYIVLTTGVPIRIKEGGYSVDSHISTMNMNLQPIGELTEENIRRCVNPYFQADTKFDSSKYNMYLVTRLIGYTVEDAKRLVDNSLAAQKTPGPYFIDMAGNRTTGGYGQMQTLMLKSFDVLKAKSIDVEIDKTDEYKNPGKPLMGYCTWGSNDGKFNGDTYRKITFLPGAVCETFVSTSARTFRPTSGGQSLIADLIGQGVTGVKGYVSEPYTFALAHPDMLFDRYTSGFNLAESFYSASLVIKWKDLVVGDPLCRPYAN